MPGGASSLTATVITSLPYTDSDTSPSPSGRWYQYVSPSPALPNELGVFVYAPGNINLYTRVFSPDAVSPYQPDDPIDSVQNKAFQIPVVAGVAYYFHICEAGAYTISVVAGPNLPAPAGSLFINDDVPGWPLALLSSIDGTVLRFIHPFPSGEAADVIPSGTHGGRILVQDSSNAHLTLYSPQLVRLADLAYGTPTGATFPIRTNSALTDRFFVGMPVDPAHGNKASVTTVTSAGAFGPTTWILPAAGLTGLAPSLDATILYFAGQNSSIASPVERWDLVNDVALANLAAGIANYRTQDDIMVLADGTILVCYENHLSSTNPPLVMHYAADGTVLNTYTMTGSRSQDVRLASALDDPVSFWIWTKIANEVSRFTNLRVSDGATLATFDAPQYEDGIWAGAITASPSARFGHSESCPFLVIRVPVPDVIYQDCPCEGDPWTLGLTPPSTDPPTAPPHDPWTLGP